MPYYPMIRSFLSSHHGYYWTVFLQVVIGRRKLSGQATRAELGLLSAKASYLGETPALRRMSSFIG